MKPTLDKISQTTEGYEVKNLKWNPLDNIIVGQVKDNINPNLRGGWTTVQWKRNGTPTNRFKGIKELYLKMPVDEKEISIQERL